MELAERIASYVNSVKYNDLDEEVVKEVKWRVLDSLAVSWASRDAEPVKISRSLVNYYMGNSRIFFSGESTSPDLASFINTLMIRFLDFNDTFLFKEPLHPSDSIGAIMSLASLLNSNGKDIITSIAVSYEIGARLCQSTTLRSKGYDHVNFLQVGIASGLSKLLNLDEKKTINAISITLVPNVALRETRSGELSMWKAGAAADSSRKATFASLLAMKGFTGPSKPFSGKMGFKKVIASDMNEESFNDLTKTRMVTKSMIKYFPVEYHAQSLVWACKEINVKPDSVKEVVVETFEAAKTILADEGKWRPTNKETADHSIPFIVSVCLLKGGIWLEDYNEEVYKNEKVIELMDKVKVVERKDFTSQYPEKLPNRVIVRTSSGELEGFNDVPLGHYLKPLSEEQLLEKCKRLGLPQKLINKVMNMEGLSANEFLEN